MERKFSRLPILILLLISLFFLFSFSTAQDPAGKTFVVDEELISAGSECGSGYNEEANFTDGAENSVKFCVKRSNYSEGSTYVTYSKFEII